jgi:hypothetical protein
MSRPILILSRCEKEIKEGYIFHFKGFYFGNKINKLVVKTYDKKNLVLNSDYLLWAHKVDVINGVLKVKVIKYKKIL